MLKSDTFHRIHNRKSYTQSPRYWNVPVLVNTGIFRVYQYCLKMWYLHSLEHASVIQKYTILEHKNGLVCPIRRTMKNSRRYSKSSPWMTGFNHETAFSKINSLVGAYNKKFNYIIVLTLVSLCPILYSSSLLLLLHAVDVLQFFPDLSFLFLVSILHILFSLYPSLWPASLA